MTRRIALACLTPRTDGDEHGSLTLPSHGVRRIQTAVIGDFQRPDRVVRLFDRAAGRRRRCAGNSGPPAPG